jgi:outer membrane protein assembly factor BamB
MATFGNGVHRNMVNLIEKNLPLVWNVEEKKRESIKWVGRIGGNSNANPVVFGGRVFVSTNNEKPRDPKIKGAKAVLMCFAEKDGTFLWQNIHDMPPDEVIRADGMQSGLCSTPTAQGDLVYYCGPACDVICAQAKDGKIVWRYDMMKELKVFPCYLCACSPLIVGDMIYIMTGNGKNDSAKVAAPQAPSFVALYRETGKLAWQSNLPGNNIIQGQWANCAYAEADGKPQVIFPGGDGYLYGLQPKTGNLIWKFKCSPEKGKDGKDTRNYIIATPVVDGNRVYIGVGTFPDLDKLTDTGHFFCIDITRSGEVSCKNDNFDSKAPANKDSALVWHFGGPVLPPPAKGREQYFGPTTSTAAVHDGLVYIAELDGYLHCLDAKTGQHYWEHDFKTTVLGSPYWADGKVYICSHDGECHIFEHGKKLRKLRSNDMDEGGLDSTPVAANGVLYISTPTKVYAIGTK